MREELLSGACFRHQMATICSYLWELGFGRMPTCIASKITATQQRSLQYFSCIFFSFLQYFGLLALAWLIRISFHPLPYHIILTILLTILTTSSPHHPLTAPPLIDHRDDRDRMILMLLLVIGKFPPRVFQRLTKMNVIAPPGYLCFVFFSCFRPELHPHLSPLPRPSPLYPVLYISSLTLLCQALYRFTLPGSPPDQRPDQADGKSLERDSSMFSFSEQSRILIRDL